ncbi:MAG: Uma2 family endonuclease [Labilithrix sp.]|nr:Uma2 family endonuclease [Labilithrix sp.]
MSETELIRLDRYTDAAKSLVVRAQELADKRRHARVEPIHLLVCILQRAPALFDKVGADPAALTVAAAVELEGLARGNEDSYLSRAMWKHERTPERPRGRPIRIRPDWVCEILSSSNARNDLGIKPAAHHRTGVPHYWIVDPARETLTVYRSSSDG